MKKALNRTLWTILLLLQGAAAFSQVEKVLLPGDSVYVDVATLDTIYFRPGQGVQSVADLIALLQRDTTFYKSFRNLRFVTYNAEHQVKVYDKKGQSVVASMEAESKHIYRDRCYWMNVLEENISGRYYDKKDHPDYYTTALYHDIFYNKEKVCGEENVLSRDYLQPSGTAMEKHKAQLKLMMFSPGTRIRGIPFIGNKASIFDPDIARDYDFSMRVEEKNGVQAYLFEAVPKPGKEGNVVYRVFKTWFDPYDFHILARDYHLKYNARVYDFDVKIRVELTEKHDMLLVRTIYFNGNWRVIGQGRERVMFSSRFYH